MKRLVLTAAVTLACVAAFAQGRISFQTDSLHLAYYSGGPLDGQAVSSGNYPGGVTLVADLYMGTSSSSLSLFSTTTFSATSGKWNTLSVTAPSIPGGTTVFVVAQIRDSAFAAPTTMDSASQPFGTYYGRSQEFSFVLGTSSLQYPPMYTTGASLGGGFSTWPVGTFAMDFVSPGQRGAIAVSPIPEPTSFALAGLGAAAMLIFRRRK